MALITALERITMERNTVHENVAATYSIFRDDKGDNYLQIDTYGTSHRQIPNKKSQSIQFGPEALNQLREVLDLL